MPRPYLIEQESQLRQALQLAGFDGQLEKGQEPGALLGAEPVTQLLEVPGEEAGRVAVAGARLPCKPLGLGPVGAQGREECSFELRHSFGRRIGAGEDRVDHRKTRALEPESAEIVVRSEERRVEKECR